MLFNKMIEFIVNRNEMSSHYHRSRGSTLGWIARRRREQGGARDVQGRHEDEPRLDKFRSRGDVQPTPRVGAESGRRLLVCPGYVVHFPNCQVNNYRNFCIMQVTSARRRPTVPRVTYSRLPPYWSPGLTSQESVSELDCPMMR